MGPIGTLVTVNIRFGAPGRPGRAQNCPQNCFKIDPKLPDLCRDDSSQGAGWGPPGHPSGAQEKQPNNCPNLMDCYKGLDTPKISTSGVSWNVEFSGRFGP